ncbi:MAG: Na-translocating system protein MpsC family protein [Planctomycetaceae bacterium]
MTPAETAIRVLIVDDNRDGADALGLVVEALGHQVHVTYSGHQALHVATAFRPDLMLIDLAMPEMDGCVLANQFRQIPAFAHTTIVAVTGHADAGRTRLAMNAGFDGVLSKPVSLQDITKTLEGVKFVPSRQPATSRRGRGPVGEEPRLSIGEARRIRSQRNSKALTQEECQAALCEGILGFQEEYMGWRSEQIHSYIIGDLLVVRIQGTLTLAERHLGKTVLPEMGRDLIKQSRKQLVELARPMLESLVHEVAGIKVQSMHHDISTVTGEEIIVFTLVEPPRFG